VTINAAKIYGLVAGSTVGAANRVVSGDFNRDGKLDLVALDTDNSVLRIYLNDGSGSFNNSYTYDFYGNGYYAFSLLTTDFNEDGKQDVVVGVTTLGDGIHFGKTGLQLLTGAGDGTFSLAALVGNSDFSPWVGYPVRVHSFDVRQDGHAGLMALTTQA